VDALPQIERTVSEIGAKVARARAERGWSLAQLAQRAGLSAAAVHKRRSRR
jgi:transcriptional regulator with XRE-family HTH domain